MYWRIPLFCLPFAGGNVYSYREFPRYHADFIDIIVLDLPGHGRRIREPLLTNIDDMVDDIFYQIKGDLGGSYAIYGHSMGALIGYVLSQKIRQEKMSMPVHFFVSGHQGPCVASKQKNWHLLPKKEFIEKVMEYGGIPKEIVAEKDLMDLFVPILKADFQAISDYNYKKTTLLEIPVTVMIGLDEDISYEEALQWQNITTQKIVVKQFPGNHFFIFDHLPKIGNLISRTLEETLEISKASNTYESIKEG